MTAAKRPTADAFDRILLALDWASHNRVALDAAVEFASLISAQLEGLFVEDIDLLRSLALPFTRHVSLTGALAETADPAMLERELQLLAAQFRRALEAAARRSQLQYSFRVVRGRLSTEVEAAAGVNDLIVVTADGRSLTRHVRLGAPGQSAVLALDRSVLILRPDVALPKTIIAGFDGTPEGVRALRIAARLARSRGGRLRILMLRDGPAHSSLERAAREALADSGTEFDFDATPAADPTTLAKRIGTPQSGLLVLPGRSPLLATAEREHLIDRLGCSLLLVR